MNDWQPIATAPQDGTRILVGRFMARPVTDAKDGKMAVDRWHNRADHGYEGWAGFNPTHSPATHWMSLPNRAGVAVADVVEPMKRALNQIADLGSCSGSSKPAHKLLQEAIDIATGAL